MRVLGFPTGPQAPITGRSPLKGLRRTDWIGLAVLAAALTVVDVWFLTAGRHDSNVGLFILWCCMQGLVCFAGGAFQGLRQRSWWEIVVIGAVAALVLVVIVLALADSDPGSADCPQQSSCDVSFGFGAILIAAFSVPMFTGVASLGRALGGLIADTRERRSR